MNSRMKITFIFCLAAFTLLFVALFIHRFRLAKMQTQKEEMEAEMMER